MRASKTNFLMKSILTHFEKLQELIRLVPASQRQLKAIEGTGGMVSVSDLVAYQIGWGTLLIGWYEAGKQGKMPEMPGEGFATWDYSGLASHFYKKYSYDGGVKQDAEFEKVVQRLIAVADVEHQHGNLERTGVWEWCRLKSGKEWPLSKWMQINTVAPYKRAAVLIRKFLKSSTQTQRSLRNT
jgi:hypothetical protein